MIPMEVEGYIELGLESLHSVSLSPFCRELVLIILSFLQANVGFVMGSLYIECSWPPGHMYIITVVQFLKSSVE